MTTEIWKPIPGFGGWYEASSFGRIRSVDRVVKKMHGSGVMMRQTYKGKILTPTEDDGYFRVSIGVDRKRMLVSVHRLILLAFHGDPIVGNVGRHLNGNPRDNRPSNLSWGTHFDNMSDRKAHGRYAAGENHVMAKIASSQVTRIRKSSQTGKSLSKEIGISESQISRIRRGESWSHI